MHWSDFFRVSADTNNRSNTVLSFFLILNQHSILWRTHWDHSYVKWYLAVYRITASLNVSCFKVFQLNRVDLVRLLVSRRHLESGNSKKKKSSSPKPGEREETRIVNRGQEQLHDPEDTTMDITKSTFLQQHKITELKGWQNQLSVRDELNKLVWLSCCCCCCRNQPLYFHF